MAARLRYLVPALVAAAVFAVPAANAGLIGNLLGNCPTGGTQVFAPWQDAANYLLAPNGSFEFGSAGWSLSGHKGVVYNAPSADHIIVLARTAGSAREEKGLTLFLVDAKAKGITRRDYPTQDALRASELTFDKVSVGAESVLGTVDGAFPVVEDSVDRAIVALCAEATGCMDAINAATLEYIKTRKQFGVPIGKFQVLQHRMVDCFTNAQEARSMTLMASLKIDDKDPVVRRKAASGAKVQIGKSGKFCGQSAVQMHGGMGVTDELSVSHYFKRLTMIDLMFGNQQHHLTRYSNLAMAA